MYAEYKNVYRELLCLREAQTYRTLICNLIESLRISLDTGIYLCYYDTAEIVFFLLAVIFHKSCRSYNSSNFGKEDFYCK